MNTFLHFIQEYDPGLGGLTASVAFLGGLLWFIFKSAVAQAVKPDFEAIRASLSELQKGQATLENRQARLEEGLTRLQSSMERVEAILQREKVQAS